MASVLEQMDSFGASVFLTHQGVETRVTEASLWRAFEQPVLIWVHGETFGDPDLEHLIAVARRFPQIQRFRFTSTRVSPEGLRRLGEIWPNALIE